MGYMRSFSPFVPPLVKAYKIAPQSLQYLSLVITIGIPKKLQVAPRILLRKQEIRSFVVA